MTEADYITSATGRLDRIKRINEIIIALENMAINAAGKGDISQYSLNDGQITISTTYRSLSSIADAINDFMYLLEVLQNQIQGRSFMLRDARNFNLIDRDGY